MSMIGCFAAITPATLASFQDDPDSIESYVQPEDGEPDNYLDLDKAWHGLHWIYTGEVDGGEGPLALAISGGEEIGPEVGYGSARFLTPEQVREVARALAAFSVDRVRERFDPRRMSASEIYPIEQWKGDPRESLSYLSEKHAALVAFYRDAARRGDGVLQWLA